MYWGKGSKSERMFIVPNLKDIKNKDKLEDTSSSKTAIEVFSLDQSIWAPREDRCQNIKDIKTKVPAINILGDNLSQRAKSLRWALRGNSHIKEIYEEFSKGNQWCIIIFDCESGFESAKLMLASRKDEFEQIKLLRDEIVTRNPRVSKPTSKTQTKDTKKDKN